MNIHVEGTSIPNPIGTFEELKLKQQKIRKILLQNIENSEYKEPTPIQMQAIPSLLLRRDVLATAPTGSGKTAAFVIPILANLCTPQQEGIRCVVLAPTRELAIQIQAEFIRLSHGRKFHILLLSKATAATITSYTKYVLYLSYNCIMNGWVYLYILCI
jgi:ATP-dependent RNA helicase DDX52/ROK1